MEIHIARSLDEIESIRKDWQEMHSKEKFPKPNADIDRFNSVIESNADSMSPYVMSFRDSGKLVSMVVARSEEKNLDLRLGYKTLFNFKLKCLSVVYGGVLGQMKEGNNFLIVKELIKQLKNKQADMIFFNYLDTNSGIYNAAQKTPGFLMQGNFQQPKEHWVMAVPDKIEDFYSRCSKNHRSNLRRSIKKFKENFPNSRFVTYTCEKGVEDFLKSASEVSLKTYQNALGAGVVNDEKTKRLLKSAAKNNWFDGNILFLDKSDKNPCAFHLALNYRNTHYMDRIGYNSELENLKPGTVLFLRKLESLCKNPDINQIDFYFGDSEYKRRYGTWHWPEACVYIFAPRVYPIIINGLQKSIGQVDSGLRYVVDKFWGKDKIKQRWRELLKRNGKNNHYM